MLVAPLVALTLSQSSPGPSPVCISEDWAAQIIARETLDTQYAAVFRQAQDAGESTLADLAAEHLRKLRSESAAFLLQTAEKHCVEHWSAERFDVQRAFDLIVRHSHSDPGDDPALAQRTLGWYRTLHADGVVDGVTLGGLEDRLMVLQSGHQLYGSHVGCIDGAWRFDPPVHQPEQLQARRDAIGWPSGSDAILGEPCP